MLSYRLKTIADYVEKCDTIVDVGTDHAYIPIWLIKNNICKKAIATDVSKGSALKAENNIRLNRLTDKISVRCGNGLETVGKDENVDCIIISGMGGILTVEIMSSGLDVLNKAKQIILQPQKDLQIVRKFVLENGFVITDEYMLNEGNKPYTVINIKKGKSDDYTREELYFGKHNIDSKSDVLREYIEVETNKLRKAIDSIESNINENNRERYNYLKEEYTMYKGVLNCLSR